MDPVGVDLQRAVGAFTSSAERFTNLLRSLPDAGVPGTGDWSAGETAAHLANAAEMYVGIANGHGSPMKDVSPAAVAHFNAEVLARDPQRDLGVLAGRIDAAAAKFVDAVRKRGEDYLISWPGDSKLPVSTLLCNGAAELLLHGFDLARRSDKAWSMDQDHAATIIDGLFPVMPLALDREKVQGVTARYDVRVRGGSRVFLFFHDQALTIEEPSSAPVDCHVSADPVSYLLVGYGRVSQWGPALKGKLLAWGRKPWLALKLPSLLNTP